MVIPAQPNDTLYYTHMNNHRKFIRFCAFSDFFYRYVPTRLWGFSGHVQTVLHSIVGRVKCPWPLGERVYLSLSDGSTLTYDLYQPLNEHEGIYSA